MSEFSLTANGDAESASANLIPEAKKAFSAVKYFLAIFKEVSKRSFPEILST